MTITINVYYKTYPGLGRPLTAEDVGKKILRVVPKNRECGFLVLGNDPGYHAAVLKTFADRKITVLCNDTLLTLDNSWMDSNWLTLDEFLTKTQGIAATIYTHVDIDPPY